MLDLRPREPSGNARMVQYKALEVESSFQRPWRGSHQPVGIFAETRFYEVEEKLPLKTSREVLWSCEHAFGIDDMV